jgi:hypothetical protein
MVSAIMRPRCTIRMCREHRSVMAGRGYDQTLSWPGPGGSGRTVIPRAVASRTLSPGAATWAGHSGTVGRPTPGKRAHARCERPDQAAGAAGWRATWRRTQRLPTACTRSPVHGSEPAVQHGRSGRTRRRQRHPRSGWRRADPAAASARSLGGIGDTRRRARRSVHSCQQDGGKGLFIQSVRSERELYRASRRNAPWGRLFDLAAPSGKQGNHA